MHLRSWMTETIQLHISKKKDKLKINLEINWLENRVEYYNLKKNPVLNQLSALDMDQIWTPFIVFQNTDDNKAVIIGSKY